MPSSSVITNSSAISHGRCRFLIIDAPNDSNLPHYLEEFAKHNVRYIVRISNPTYSTDTLAAAGIKVIELPFPDGEGPPAPVVARFLDLCDDAFSHTPPGDVSTPCIAVHCVAGLGRAATLVALALIEDKMSAFEAVRLVRAKRRGAINSLQLRWLESYKPRSKGGCSLM
eukprot:gnl/Ergobibamus_cyprinoides/120.p2 GENE.gnl/Ergobibamus_cyprinoides/120~~gnl/Ergobibamus_cyprinoides/120.p2  ORF type:complete len:170 (+),score=61.21 gnl/Ergobibamus_cyprinoides/120:172-681(+)